MANVPSFRFSFRGNIRRNHPFGNHPFVNTKKGHWEIKGRFPKGWFWQTYPRSGFRSGGTSAETTLFGNLPYANPRLLAQRITEDLVKILCKIAQKNKELQKRGAFGNLPYANPRLLAQRITEDLVKILRKIAQKK